jgi:hypothetical protein
MLEIWISQADRHWKKHQPRRYARLKQAGTLAAELRAAAELTDKERQDLQAGGMRPDEAWMATREKYLFPPEEPHLTALDEEEMDSPLHAMIVEKNRLLREIDEDD